MCENHFNQSDMIGVYDVFIQPPSYYYKKPSELPAIEAPHPGTSYRPAASDHWVLYICILILMFDNQFNYTELSLQYLKTDAS